MLHSIFATTNAPTGSGTEDRLGAAAFKPSSEASVQERLGDSRPVLVGIDSVVVETDMAQEAYLVIQGNTWDVSDYIQRIINRYHTTQDTVPTANVQISQNNPDIWFAQGNVGVRQMVPEEDWLIDFATQTASIDIGIMLYLIYGGVPVQPNFNPWTWRRIVKGSNVTADAWTEIGTITDLHPEKYFRIAALGGWGGTNPLAFRITHSIMNGLYIGALGSQFYDTKAITTFPFDSGVISGKGTTTIEAYCGAASDPIAYVGLQEVVATAPGGGSPGAIPFTPTTPALRRPTTSAVTPGAAGRPGGGLVNPAGARGGTPQLPISGILTAINGFLRG